jgi:hypothetical protein
MFNNTVFILNKTISRTEIFDLIQYKRILFYKQINPDYVDCFSVNQIASQVKRFTANCTGNCNGNANDSNSNIFPAPPIRTTTTTSSTTCPPTTSTTSSTTTNTTTCKPSGLTFFTLTTEMVYESITYNFSEMTSLEICDLLLSICYPYTGDFTYTTVIGETTEIDTGNLIFDPFTPCTFLPNGTYLEGLPGDSCGTVANIFDVVDGVITEVVTTCNVVTTTTTTTRPPEDFIMVANNVPAIARDANPAIIIDSLSAFKIIWGDGTEDSFTAGNNRQASHTYPVGFPYSGNVIIQAVDLSNITRLTIQSTLHNPGTLSVTTDELAKLDALQIFIADLPNGIFVTGIVDQLPRSLITLTIANTNIFGDTLLLPRNLTTCNITGSNTISGTVSNLPRAGLPTLSLTMGGLNTIIGDVTNLPKSTLSCVVTGNATLTGTTANLPKPSNLLIINCTNSISGNVANLSKAVQVEIFGQNVITGDISGFGGAGGTGNTTTSILVFKGNNTVFGNVNDFPNRLARLEITGNCSFSGNLSDLQPVSPPAQVLSFVTLVPSVVGGTGNTFNGSASTLPTSLTSLKVSSSGLFDGDLIDLPPNIIEFNVGMKIDLTYDLGITRTWATGFYSISTPSTTGTAWAGFTKDETDKLILEIAPSYVQQVPPNILRNRFQIRCGDDPKRSFTTEVNDAVALIEAGLGSNIILYPLP